MAYGRPKHVFWHMLPKMHSHVLSFCVVQDLGSPTIEQVDQPTIDDETVLIVPSSHGFIQTSDDIDSESVLPLTTLTGMYVYLMPELAFTISV